MNQANLTPKLILDGRKITNKFVKIRVLYVNTSEGSSLFYDIDESVSPLVNLSMSYSNRDGGIDIHSGVNVFDFTITAVSNKDLNGVNIVFQAEKDNYGENDALNILAPSSPSLTRC